MRGGVHSGAVSRRVTPGVASLTSVSWRCDARLSLRWRSAVEHGTAFPTSYASLRSGTAVAPAVAAQHRRRLPTSLASRG